MADNEPGKQTMRQLISPDTYRRQICCRAGMAVVLILILGFPAGLYAQAEDTVRVEVERDSLLQEQNRRYSIPARTPYQTDINRFGGARYKLYDHTGTYDFYRKLNYQDAEDFLMSEEERYDPYGPEWERQLNETILAFLEATTREESAFLQTLARIAPFLGFGFFERYEHPVPERIENPEKISVD